MEWTQQRIDILRKLWGQGQSASQIAALLGGVTRNAVIGKAHRLGLTGRPSPIRRETVGEATPKRKAVAPRAAALPPLVAPQPALGQEKSLPPRPVAAAPRSLHAGTKTCSWPVGDPKHADFHFCGEPSDLGRPYCARHCAIAYHRKIEAA